MAFSDFRVGEQFARRYPGCEGLLNTIEDALIERRAMERWPGVRANLDAMFVQIRGRVAQLIQQRGPFDRFCTAVYLKLSHHHDMLGLDRELVGYEDLLARFQQIRTTREAGELAELILQRWQQQAAQRQKQQHDSSGTKAERQNPRDQSGKATQADGRSEGSSPSGRTRPGDGDHSPNQHSDSGQQYQDDTEPGSSEDPPDDSVPQCSESSRGSEAQPEPSGRKSASTDSGRGRSGSRRRKLAKGRARASCSQIEDTEPSAEGTEVLAGQGAGGSPVSLISEALREAISEQVAHLDGARDYRPFTRQFDRIETVNEAGQADVQTLLDTGRDTVRRLRRGLTNTLRSAEKRWWRDDQLRGDLSPRTLHRLCMDRPRLDVFRTRAAVQGKSTAVSILLDASGSMTTRKIDVARSAMRVLLEALGDLKIVTEALTFTTGNLVEVAQLVQQSGLDAQQLRERYGRLSNLEIGLVKQFGEPVKVALARLPTVHGTGLTPLGEAMRIAAARLAPRPETRKILLVLTDGKAGCEGGSDAATAHAQEIARRIVKAGIELVGVGILDESVRDVVADSIVIQTLEELPAQLCKLLGRTLKKGLRHVG